MQAHIHDGSEQRPFPGSSFLLHCLGMPEHLMADISQKIFLARDGKVLLTLDLKGKWQPPGGRLNVGENPAEGLKREIQEELGIDATVGNVLHTFVFTSASGLAHYVVIHLASYQGPLEAIKPDPKEMTEVRWFGPGEFEQVHMREGYKEALRNYFHARTP